MSAYGVSWMKSTLMNKSLYTLTGDTEYLQSTPLKTTARLSASTGTAAYNEKWRIVRLNTSDPDYPIFII